MSSRFFWLQQMLTTATFTTVEKVSPVRRGLLCIRRSTKRVVCLQDGQDLHQWALQSHSIRSRQAMKIALIDNYDSFTHNIYDLIYRVSGKRALVLRNDEMTYTAFRELAVDSVVISPGPGHPARTQDFGICSDVLLHSAKPVFGICLGHQGIGAAFGGNVSLAPQPVHGLTVDVFHDGMYLFEGIPQGVKMVRYHSLIVGSPLPDTLLKTAWTDDGLIMGLRHKNREIFGVQFHPESICSQYGDTLMANFLRIAVQ
jgi:anthranilate synthase component 2